MKTKSGRSQPRFRAPASKVTTTDLLDWSNIEDYCGVEFSRQARIQIEFALGKYKAAQEWPTITESEFRSKAEDLQRKVDRLIALLPEIDDPFATAIRAALREAEVSPQGLEWDGASQRLREALREYRSLIQYSTKVPSEAEEWPGKPAWNQCVLEVAQGICQKKPA